VRFEWDEAKNRSNRRKHGVSFEVARRVFEDPLALMLLDRQRVRKNAGAPSGVQTLISCWS
jgi:hypothetical protein